MNEGIVIKAHGGVYDVQGRGTTLPLLIAASYH